jgi:hypothetical protein
VRGLEGLNWRARVHKLVKIENKQSKSHKLRSLSRLMSVIASELQLLPLDDRVFPIIASLLVDHVAFLMQFPGCPHTMPCQLSNI